MNLPREDSAKTLTEFYETLWHNEEGYVYLPTKDSDSTWKKNFFKWPENKKGIAEWTLEQSASNKDVYCSPVIFNEPKDAVKANVKGSFTLWGDWDGEAPEWHGEGRERATDALPGVPPPSARVQSSLDKREHLYWSLSEFNTDIEYIEQLNRRIAYSGNADTGCWNVNRVLRPPETINTGNGKDRKALPVTLLETNSSKVTRDDFSQLPTAKTLIKESIRELKELPSLETVYAGENWSEELMALFKADTPDAGDRSRAMVRLAMLSAELGFREESIYVVVDDADKRWKKYTDRSDAERQRLLINMVDRAKAKHPEALPDMIWSPTISVDQQVTYGLKDFLDTDIHIDWMIEGILPVGGMGVIAAAPGVGKTILSLDLALSLAMGDKQYLKWDIVKPAKILYLSLEMAHGPLKEFMSKVVTDLSEEQIETLNDKFIVAPVNETILMDKKPGEEFIKGLLEKHSPDLVIVDSLGKMLMEIQSDEAVRRFDDTITRLRKTYNTAFLFIHHNKKPSENKPATQTDMFGSTYVAAISDVVISMWKPNDQSHQIRIALAKARFTDPGTAFVIHRKENLRYEIEVAEDGNSLVYGEETTGAAKDPNTGTGTALQ